MWWELAIDVLWPTRAPKSVERSVERIAEMGASGTLRVESAVAGAFKRRLNESGWLADEVIEAGMLQQGRPPSLLALTTGLVLLQMARSRRSKSLPREFALAVTADRVVAFALSPLEGGRAHDRFCGRRQDQARPGRLVAPRLGAPDRSPHARRDERRDATARGRGTLRGQVRRRSQHRRTDRVAPPLTTTMADYEHSRTAAQLTLARDGHSGSGSPGCSRGSRQRWTGAPSTSRRVAERANT